mmetsp:Transcript_9939/g.16254  ORF Transcript_9939/g.16254 Transcript_9939/m.16254 type:complete len:91 (-) Transcript_9939:810-1082(-)
MSYFRIALGTMKLSLDIIASIHPWEGLGNEMILTGSCEILSLPSFAKVVLGLGMWRVFQIFYSEKNGAASSACISSLFRVWGVGGWLYCR